MRETKKRETVRVCEIEGKTVYVKRERMCSRKKETRRERLYVRERKRESLCVKERDSVCERETERECE